ncbi:uncharacterized protein LOC128984878 [Macrosteles quadrilineatus]|uniref:uncharacterized protein LOC128984878 n=1 Tax=Macrosteles quadrilineatus TaxID=74068 RepID=UPI0023E26CC6|nr:uncharacterized protein LOC128984878 [Macrosteles quadrilineatus]
MEFECEDCHEKFLYMRNLIRHKELGEMELLQQLNRDSPASSVERHTGAESSLEITSMSTIAISNADSVAVSLSENIRWRFMYASDVQPPVGRERSTILAHQHHFTTTRRHPARRPSIPARQRQQFTTTRRHPARRPSIPAHQRQQFTTTRRHPARRPSIPDHHRQHYRQTRYR